MGMSLEERRRAIELKLMCRAYLETRRGVARRRFRILRAFQRRHQLCDTFSQAFYGFISRCFRL